MEFKIQSTTEYSSTENCSFSDNKSLSQSWNSNHLVQDIEDIVDFWNYRRILFHTALAVLVIGVVGNCLVVTLFIRWPHLRTVSNSFLLSLTTADLLTSLVSVLNFALFTLTSREVRNGPNAWCLLRTVLPHIGITASAWSLLAMTLDRFLSIHLPLRYGRSLSMKFAIVFITLLWLFSIMLNISPVINAGIQGKTVRASLCTGLLLYTLAIQLTRMFLGLLTPCLGVIVFYLLIVRTARKHALAMAVQMAHSDGDKGQWRHNARVVTKAAVVYLIICVVFACGWLPSTLVHSLFMLCSSCDWLVLGYISIFTGTVALSSCAVNPWLHTMRNRVFRQALRSMLCCPTRGRHRRVVKPAPCRINNTAHDQEQD